MPTISEVEELARALPERERAELVSNLLDSLPSPFAAEDEGIEEALRRSADFDANPNSGITLAQFNEQLDRRRSP